MTLTNFWWLLIWMFIRRTADRGVSTYRQSMAGHSP